MDGIRITSLSKSYRIDGKTTLPVLSGCSMTLAPGEFLALTGESGCGKSTLAKLLLGLASFEAGEILIDGTDIGRLAPRAWRPLRRVIQGVFQDSGGALNPRMSVLDNMTETLRNTGVGKKDREAAALSLMDLLGLDRQTLDVPARSLSGGSL